MASGERTLRVRPVVIYPRYLGAAWRPRKVVYAVTMTGTTGSTNSPARADAALDEYLQRVRDASPLPVLAGFGIRSAEQLARVGARADGAIVGSALIETLERNEDPIGFLRSLRGGEVKGKGASS